MRRRAQPSSAATAVPAGWRTPHTQGPLLFHAIKIKILSPPTSLCQVTSPSGSIKLAEPRQNRFANGSGALQPTEFVGSHGQRVPASGDGGCATERAGQEGPRQLGGSVLL